MKFARELYSAELVQEMMPLWQKHYDEIAAFKDIALDPDLEMYATCAKYNTLRIFTARLNSSLIGYQVFFVNRHPHYQQSIQAVQDILFLELSARKGLTGYKFIKFCDEELRKEGVQVVMQHVKKKFDFSPILKRMGYQDHDKVLARRLI